MDASYDRKRYVKPCACLAKLLQSHVDEASHKHRFYAKYKRGTKEPLHIHAKASVEWVVLSGKFDVETGPVFHVPGHDAGRRTWAGRRKTVLGEVR